MVENVKVQSHYHRVDLWVAIQIPEANLLLFRIPDPLVQFDPKPQPFKESLETQKQIHRLLDFEVILGLGGMYTFYAVYVEEGKNPMEDDLKTIQRSNLAIQSTTLANCVLESPQNKLKAYLERLGDINQVRIEKHGAISAQIGGQTHYGQLDEKRMSSRSLVDCVWKLEPTPDVNGDGKNDYEITYLSGEKQILYYLGTEK